MARRVIPLMRILVIASLSLLAAGVCHIVAAQVPDKLNYQGYLTNPGGAPVTASVPMVFKLYNVASGGAALYSETQTVSVANGIFNVAIGSVTALNLPFDVPYYLGVTVGADAEMTPRQQVLSSAYAQRADAANTLASTATVGGAQITGTITVATVPTAQLTGTIGTAQIANNAVTQAKLSPASGAAPGKVLGTDGSNLQWQAAGGGGTVTSVGSGPGLTGGPITTTGSLAADTAYLQRRVSSTCAVGSSIRAIAADGSVTCQTDNAGPANAFVQGGNAFGGTAILGTTDNNALEINVNGGRVTRFEPNATSPNIVGGHPNNTSAGYGSTVSGGGQAGNGCFEQATGTFTRSCGNSATSHATVAGGLSNIAAGNRSSVSGGEGNTASGGYSTIAGGVLDIASGSYAAMGGGVRNIASGYGSAVGGGSDNVASGTHSVVAGGFANVAGGEGSFAAGQYARVRDASQSGDFNGDEGTFLWADNHFTNFFSAGPNEFAARATGGVRFVTAVDFSGNPTRTVKINPNGEAEFGNQTRQMLNLWGPAQYGIGVQAYTMYFRTDVNDPGNNRGGFSWYKGGVHDDAINAPGFGGTEMMRLAYNGTLYVTGGAVGNLSDRNAKQDFAAIDAAVMLDKVARLPLSSWVYKANPGVRHLGPTSQDFRAAFGLGDDDERSIATVDADGVALAAIQGLNAKLEAKLAEQARELAAERAAREAQTREIAALREEVAVARMLASDVASLKATLAEMLRERATVAAR